MLMLYERGDTAAPLVKLRYRKPYCARHSSCELEFDDRDNPL